MWDRESRRAARRQYRDARRQYRASRRFYRRNARGYSISIVGIIILVALFSHPVSWFPQISGHALELIIPIIIIFVFIFIVLPLRWRARQNFFQSFAPPPQQPQQDVAPPYYQGFQSSEQPGQQPEAYQGYDQGYQTNGNQLEGKEQMYRTNESYRQEEEPQALYPQQMPPLEQS